MPSSSPPPAKRRRRERGGENDHDHEDTHIPRTTVTTAPAGAGASAATRTTTKTTRKTNRKSTKKSATRSRGTTTAAGAAVPPPPPPAPPASLVAFLRQDSHAFDYFTALHTSITYDTEKWKHRAVTYKHDLDTALRLQQQHQQQPQQKKKKKNTTSKRKRNTNSNSSRINTTIRATTKTRTANATKQNTTAKQTKQKNQQQTQSKIAEDEFELSSSSSASASSLSHSDQDDHAKARGTGKKQGTTITTRPTQTSSKTNAYYESATTTKEADTKNRNNNDNGTFEFDFDSDTTMMDKHDNTQNTNTTTSATNKIESMEFELSFSSDNNEDDNDTEETEEAEAGREETQASRSGAGRATATTTHCGGRLPERLRIGWQALRQAEHDLQHLGIRLSTTTTTTTTITKQDEDETRMEEEEDSSITRRRRKSPGDPTTTTVLGNGIRDSNDHHQNTIDADNTDEQRAPTTNCVQQQQQHHTRTSDDIVLKNMIQIIKEWTLLNLVINWNGIHMNNNSNNNSSDARNTTASTCTHGGNNTTATDTSTVNGNISPFTGKAAVVDNAVNSNTSSSNYNNYVYRYASFVTKDAIPCFVPVTTANHGYVNDTNGYNNANDDAIPTSLPLPPQHPAVKGVTLLLKALCIIDTYGSILDEIHIIGDTHTTPTPTPLSTANNVDTADTAGPASTKRTILTRNNNNDDDADADVTKQNVDDDNSISKKKRNNNSYFSQLLRMECGDDGIDIGIGKGIGIGGTKYDSSKNNQHDYNNDNIQVRNENNTNSSLASNGKEDDNEGHIKNNNCNTIEEGGGEQNKVEMQKHDNTSNNGSNDSKENDNDADADADTDTDADADADTNNDDERINNKEEEMKKFAVGMKQRKKMVQQFVESLEGEICELWPVQDRYDRTANTSLHYNHNNNGMSYHDDSLCGIDKGRGENENTTNSTTSETDVVSLSNNKKEISGTNNKRFLIYNLKSTNRLAFIVERCMYVRIVTGLYLHRNDPSSAIQFLFRYVLSTAPSSASSVSSSGSKSSTFFGEDSPIQEQQQQQQQQQNYIIEDHPKLPPVQSLCIIETVLTTQFFSSCINNYDHPDDANKIHLNADYSSTATTALESVVVATGQKQPQQLLNRTLFDYMQDKFVLPADNGNDTDAGTTEKSNNTNTFLLETLQGVITTTGLIFRARTAENKERRISETSRVEVAAYERLMKIFNVVTKKDGTKIKYGGINLSDGYCILNKFKLAYYQLIESSFSKSLLAIPQQRYQSQTRRRKVSSIAEWVLPIFWVLQCDGPTIRKVFIEWSEKFLHSVSSLKCHQDDDNDYDDNDKLRHITSSSTFLLIVLEACSKAVRQIEVRSIDYYRSIVSSPTRTTVTTISHLLVKELIESVTTIREKHLITFSCLSILLSICYELADGESAIRLIQWRFFSSLNDEDYDDSNFDNNERGCNNNISSTLSVMEEKINNKHAVSGCLEHWSSFPSVRVINLERRKDRMASFLSQAMHAGLWIIRGVIPPEQWQVINDNNEDKKDHDNNDLDWFIGTYAVDGSQDSPAEVERNLMSWLEPAAIASSNTKKRMLDALILPKWRPSDLRVFDSHASTNPNLLVPLSPSEKACAMSHIATWKGIASPRFNRSSNTNAKFMYAGFARGDPMHPLSKNNRPHQYRKNVPPPTPVALILEDDAICVDRFTDRLSEILEELPRDFHYCALGYAKPKEAPLIDVPGCTHIKFPTMTWYLTGYLLSQAGARYLLDHLPVVGPIDAWMGHKMILTSNWENDYGVRMRVGYAPMGGISDIPANRPTMSQKELGVCVKFRAYCASVPLCEQRVRVEVVTGTAAESAGITNTTTSDYNEPIQNWRRRDSDIVYSGNTRSSARARKNMNRSRYTYK